MADVALILRLHSSYLIIGAFIRCLTTHNVEMGFCGLLLLPWCDYPFTIHSCFKDDQRIVLKEHFEVFEIIASIWYKLFIILTDWLRTIQYLSYLGLTFLIITLIICGLFLCAEVGNNTTGIAACCLASGTFFSSVHRKMT